MTRAIICGIGLGMLLAGTSLGQGSDPYFSGQNPGPTGQTLPGQGVPGQGVPGQGVPGQGVPGQGVPGQVAPARPLETQFLNRRSFEMPVQLHDQEAREIRLYVSANGGQQWQLYNRYRPDVEMLPFACRNDGEYWFALYTINHANAVFPTPTAFDPMLKLRIDTERPLLEAQSFPSQAGGLAVRWKASDPYLNPATVKVEYRAKMATGRELPWRESAMPAPPTKPGTTYESQLNAWPETNARVLEVRVSAADWAGNQTETVQDVTLPLVAQSTLTPGSRFPATSANTQATSEIEEPEPTSIAWGSGEQASKPTTNSPSGRDPSVATQNVSSRRQGDILPDAKQNSPLIPSGNSSTSSGQTGQETWSSSAPGRSFAEVRPEDAGRLPNADNPGRPLEARSNQGGFESPPTDPSAQEAVPATRPESERVAFRPLDNERPDEAEELPPPLTGTRSNSSGADRQFQETQQRPSGSQAISLLPDTPGIPSGQIARLTNENEFRLSYEVESVGRGGVAKVQLWMTSDAGQTWKLWTEDGDCESPIAVQTPSEGVYGFRLVITARNGLAGDTPQPGELADMWVEIDRTAPTGELLQAPTRERVEEGKLLIRWNAEDRNLGRRPITLQYSDSAAGPWEILTAGLANTGQYDWRVVPSMPKQVYLRLEVRDRAGNVTHDQLPYPIDLSSLSPRGTLKGFEIN